MKPRGADLCTEPFEQVPPVLRTYMWDLKIDPSFVFIATEMTPQKYSECISISRTMNSNVTSLHTFLHSWRKKTRELDHF